jgi:hypothetical protein
MSKRSPEAPPQAAALKALRRLLGPLAKLAIARGIPFAVVEELFKQAFVRAAREARAGGGARDISRVATATGLSRREVTRLTQAVPASAATRPAPATQIFTRWISDRGLRDGRGRPRALPRIGKAPSFEALAQSVTTDVHPRSLLEELCRLGLARHDADTDRVHVLRDAFVPSDDESRMLAFLADNAGDHLDAGVANVLGEPRRHFEQAIFADELSEASVDAARRLVSAQWRALMAAITPELQALIEADERIAARDPSHVADRRLRVGLYSFDARIEPGDTGDPT